VCELVVAEAVDELALVAQIGDDTTYTGRLHEGVGAGCECDPRECDPERRLRRSMWLQVTSVTA
jgi:hypothetical protein